MAEIEALVAVIRPSGTAMFHTQDCPHGKRAMSPLLLTRDNFGPGDVRCSSCRPDTTPTTETRESAGESES